MDLDSYFKNAMLGTIKELMAKGKSINTADDNGNTFLHHACKGKNMQAVKYLVENGADIEPQNNEGQPPYYFCEDKDICRYLVEKGAIPITRNFKTNLHDICKKDDLTAFDFHVRRIIKNEKTLKGHIDLHELCSLENETENDYYITAKTPENLCYFIETGIKNGIDVNAIDRNGNTPLHIACANRDGMCVIIEILIKNGADLNFKNKKGQTPLHSACIIPRYCTIYNLKSLVTTGIDVNLQDNEGNTPLHLVMRDEHYGKEPAKLLIQNGADKNIKNKQGNIPTSKFFRL